MNIYVHNYFRVWKENLIIALVIVMLLPLTFGFWYGVPLFVLGDFLSQWNIPVPVYILMISFTIGLLFSLFLLPFNLKYAQKVAVKQQKNTFSLFMSVHMMAMIVSTIIMTLLLIAVFITA